MLSGQAQLSRHPALSLLKLVVKVQSGAINFKFSLQKANSGLSFSEYFKSLYNS